MPPPEDLPTRRVNARSSIANYVNNISKREYREEEKLYKIREASLAESKPWPEFLRLAISRQYLEGRSENAKVEVRDGSNIDKVLLSTRKREKNILGLDKREDPRLTQAIANLDQTAREYAKEGSKAHKSASRHSRHERVEEKAPRGRSKRGKTILVETRHVRRRHEADDQDAEPRRGPQHRIAAPPPRRSQMHPDYEEEYDRRRDGPGPSQGHVYPANPPIRITVPSQPSEPRRQDYQQPPHRPAEIRSHLSPADAPSISGGRGPPAPLTTSRSEAESHRADRLPERREFASRSGYGYSTRPSGRDSQERGSVRESHQDNHSQGHGSVSSSLRNHNSRVEHWIDSSAVGGSRVGRQGSRQSEVGRQSIRSSSNIYSDERGDTEAIVGLPKWGSGGDESRGSAGAK